MVSYKAVLAVALVMSVAQINGRPADTDWAKPFETTLKNITSSIDALVGADGHKYTDVAKNSFTEFVNGFNSELSTLSKTFESKAGVSDVVKEATKQWQTAVDTYTKNIPQDLSPTKLTENYENALKQITEKATELSKKAQGNSDIEKELREFTKGQIDALLKQVESIKSKLTEKKA
ncbi:Hypothetical protein CINCED_3A002948 [Cinara cedri]|uniref:Uncharacterized protein n=1 Tax=Cinara cedri TaxID=506608 RepID=A0A5E4MRN2_9HEMI|nr:Hypothetical protein CINCED_3A002948 [Cinara cedri]